MKRSSVKYKGGSVFPCNRCEFTCKSLSSLNKHRVNEHALSFNASNNLLEPRESTRNNSFVSSLMLEDAANATTKKQEDGDMTKLAINVGASSVDDEKLLLEDISIVDITDEKPSVANDDPVDTSINENMDVTRKNKVNLLLCHSRFIFIFLRSFSFFC